eukprot:SAG22_NODE_1064_length_5756_cov_48.259502_3_plen_102_part_00
MKREQLSRSQCTRAVLQKREDGSCRTHPAIAVAVGQREDGVDLGLGQPLAELCKAEAEFLSVYGTYIWHRTESHCLRWKDGASTTERQCLSPHRRRRRRTP